MSHSGDVVFTQVKKTILLLKKLGIKDYKPLLEMFISVYKTCTKVYCDALSMTHIQKKLFNKAIDQFNSAIDRTKTNFFALLKDGK